MSMFTSLKYYRPLAPPIVTGDDLAKFIEGLRRTNVIADDGGFSAEIYFGPRIDHDERDACFDEEIDGALPTLGRKGPRLKTGRLSSLAQLTNWLVGDATPIYRGFLELGALTDSARSAIARDEDDDTAFSPEWLFLQLGPVDCCTFDDEDESRDSGDEGWDESADGAGVWRVGWMELSVSGHGWLFPWTLRDAKDKMEARPEYRALMELCRTTWPLHPEEPDDDAVADREYFARLWPYDLRRAHDWSWGLAET